MPNTGGESRRYTQLQIGAREDQVIKKCAPVAHPDRATRFLVEQWVRGIGSAAQALHPKDRVASFGLNIDWLRREKSVVISIAFLEGEQGQVPIIVTSHVTH